MYRSLFQNSSEPILLIKNKKFIACNKVTLKILGLHNAKNIASISPSDISPPTQPCGMTSANKADEMITIAHQKGEHRFEWLHQNSANEFFKVEVAYSGDGDQSF